MLLYRFIFHSFNERIRILMLSLRNRLSEFSLMDKKTRTRYSHRMSSLHEKRIEETKVKCISVKIHRPAKRCHTLPTKLGLHVNYQRYKVTKKCPLFTKYFANRAPKWNDQMGGWTLTGRWCAISTYFGWENSRLLEFKIHLKFSWSSWTFGKLSRWSLWESSKCVAKI